MSRQRVITVALVVAVLLAGCSGFVDSNEPATGTTTTAATSTDVSTPTGTTTADSSTTGSSTTAAQTTEMWVRPSPPKTPLQKKLSDRIESVRIVDETKANGGGYSDFDVEVTADTRFPDVDPNSDGEPYFMVKVNDTWVTRQDVQWEQKANGTYTLEVLPDALDQFDSGTLTVTVMLLEEDTQYADLYDKWEGTVEYRSG